MADPLSITASIIAVVTAAEGVSKTLAKIKNARKAPSELSALVNEVSDLRVILNDVDSHLRRDAGRSQLLETLQHMATLLQRAKDRLLQLDQLIQYQLVKPDSTLANLKVSRREWVKAKSVIEKYRQSLRDIRLNVIAQMTVLNANYQSRIGLAIEEIRIVTNQLQADQIQGQNQVTQQLNDQSRLLADLTDNHSGLRDLLQIGYQPAQQSQITSDSSHSTSQATIDIKLRVPSNERSPCTWYCGCACHTLQQIKLPYFLRQVTGALLAGYSGYPHKMLQRCNISSCQGQRRFHISVVYSFPLWLMYRIVTATLTIDFFGEVHASLRSQRMVSETAEVINLAISNDVQGIKQLFSRGLASPNDVGYLTGQTLLSIAFNRVHLNACEFLLNAGADPSLSTALSSSVHTRAWNAIYQNSYDRTALTTLRRLFPINDDYLEERQFSFLHKIVLDIIPNELSKALMLETTRSAINVGDSNGMTPLMWAARRGDSGAVKILIEHNADVNACCQYLVTALLYAVRSSSVACVRLLLKAGANPMTKDSSQNNVLHCVAMYCNNSELIRCFIDVGAEVNGRDSAGGTPIFPTTFHDYIHTARTLLDNGADLEVYDNMGDSILYQALYFRAKKVLRLFLERGAPQTSCNFARQTILHFAALYGDLEILEILRSANLKGMDLDAEDLEGNTALQVSQKREGTSEVFVEKMQELLAEIRARNASEIVMEGTTTGEAKLSRISFFNPAKAGQHFQRVREKLRSTTRPPWNTILLYNILVLGWAGFVYQLLKPDHATQRSQRTSESMGLPAEETCAWSYDGQNL